VSEPPLRHAQGDRNERRLQRRERRRSHVHAELTERWAKPRQSSAQTHSARLTLSPTLWRCAAELQPHNCTTSHLWSSNATLASADTVVRTASATQESMQGRLSSNRTRLACPQTPQATSAPTPPTVHSAADRLQVVPRGADMVQGSTACRRTGLLHSGAYRL
jgi:hypothetical protein